MLLTFYFKITLDLQKSCKDRTKIFLASLVAQLEKKKKTACNAGEPGSIPGSQRSPEEGNDNPFQSSCLENSTERGDWQVTVQGSQRVRHDLAAEQQQQQMRLGVTT